MFKIRFLAYEMLENSEKYMWQFLKVKSLVSSKVKTTQFKLLPLGKKIENPQIRKSEAVDLIEKILKELVSNENSWGWFPVDQHFF